MENKSDFSKNLEPPIIDFLARFAFTLDVSDLTVAAIINRSQKIIHHKNSTTFLEFMNVVKIILVTVQWLVVDHLQWFIITYLIFGHL